MNTKKICKKCNVEWPISHYRSYFSTAKNRNIVKATCIDCEKDYAKKRYPLVRDLRIKSAKEWAEKNPERKKENKKRDYYKHLEKRKATNKRNALKNIDKKSAYDKIYAKENRVYKLEYAKNYNKVKRKEDLNYRLKQYIQNSLWRALKGITSPTYYSKNFGCTILHLRNYIESKFSEGMTWSNYGSWQIDHIVPCLAFDLTIPEQQHKCFHYTNLQPLWAADNIKKGKKIPQLI